MIDQNTRISLRLVFTLIACTAIGVGAWADIRHRLYNVTAQVQELRAEVKSASTANWGKYDDLVFMREFAAANNLTMPAHLRIDE